MPCYTQVLNRHFPAAPRGAIPMRISSLTALSAASLLREVNDLNQRDLIQRDLNQRDLNQRDLNQQR
jgi:hypothetical protein